MYNFWAGSVLVTMLCTERFYMIVRSVSLSRIDILPGQRSHKDLYLGPMLFILFINDIANITINGVFTKLYADNLKLYTSIISTDDCSNLQDVLSNLLVWSKDWQLEVNFGKSNVLHLHKHNPLMDYYFDGNLMESWDLVNDISVDVDLFLHFDEHIDRIFAKA